MICEMINQGAYYLNNKKKKKINKHHIIIYQKRRLYKEIVRLVKKKVSVYKYTHTSKKRWKGTNDI